MTKIKHTATDANGLVHTRTSATRTYTHCVVVRRSYEAALRRAEDGWGSDRSNYAHHAAYVDGTSRFLVRATYEKDDAKFAERCARDIANAVERLEGAETVEDYLEAQRAKRIASVKAAKAEGAYDRFGSVGWCGRLDLAQKLAAKERAMVGNAEVAILEAVTQ